MGKELPSKLHSLLFVSRRCAGGDLVEYSAILLFLTALVILAIPAFQTGLTNSYQTTSACIRASGLGAGQENCHSSQSSGSGSQNGSSNSTSGIGRGEAGGGGLGFTEYPQDRR